MNGIVKWFNDSKGFGFIQSENGDRDIFVHFTNLLMEGYKSLKEGQKVVFELYDGPRGPEAKNVRIAE